MSGAAFCAAVSIALMAWLARHLGPVTFGELTTLTAFATLVLVAIEGGWPMLVYREAASPSIEREQIARLTSNALAYLLAAAGAAAALALIAFASGSTDPAMPIAMLCMGGVAAMNLGSARMRARGYFAQEAAWQSGGRALSAIAIVGVLAVSGSTSVALIFASWGAALVLFALVFGAGWIPAPRWEGLRIHSGTAFAFATLAALTIFLQKADLLILARMQAGPEVLAFYATGTRVTEAGLLLFAPFANVLLRHFRQRSAAEGGSGTTVLPVLAVAVCGGAAAWLVVFAARGEIVAALFGAAYAEAAPLLPWIAAMLPFAFATLVLLLALAARGREKAAMAALSIAAVALIVAVPGGYVIAGARGAALGAAGSHALAALLCFLALRMDSGSADPGVDCGRNFGGYPRVERGDHRRRPVGQDARDHERRTAAGRRR